MIPWLIRVMFSAVLDGVAKEEGLDIPPRVIDLMARACTKALTEATTEATTEA